MDEAVASADNGLSSLDVACAAIHAAAGLLPAWLGAVLLTVLVDWPQLLTPHVPHVEDSDSLTFLALGPVYLVVLLALLSWRAQSPPLRKLEGSHRDGLVTAGFVAVGGGLFLLFLWEVVQELS